ncbi:MAG TPA: formylglycine-generating enzyme family protein [Candidatus Hydrogenedentes bacterium]|nr:formylglycine-generating enzyme family protein [Candidatus Hydrogenedentota bacterium]HQE81582.1 formylglycine-generating enzyme family protein [Candidatus Hydrogenedentota bacterium]HQH51497.1 formylglycine-generating enzyme family protein [Candidatus Hydrogenedentota bacterium]HQM49668.1 formylglycine-generating enzyme family protein [Candidatus Hydrogenedentota bacterium]
MNAPKDSHPGDGDKTDSPRAEASPCPDAPEPMAEPHPEAGAVHAFAGMDFVWVPPGTFLMGSPLGEEDRYEDEVQHQVAIPEGFWLGKTQVSQAQWKAVTRSHPSEFQGNHLPVECVNWNDCRGFIQKLNAQSEGVFRLPTEAEWEYACRAGTTTAYCFGDDASNLGDYAWYDENSERTAHPVGRKKPNGWGLHDMHGNVWEWCEDLVVYPTDVKGAPSGDCRAVRGGSWSDFPRACRSANRPSHFPFSRRNNCGLRLARNP